ncbi:DMT family transporter [Candidatus Curtissbacteria bacterium]|nr:DMT family transporter [Candidatus Curtissbacteria bacterium]
MIWIPLALLTAFCEATRDVLSKKSLKNLDEYILAFSRRFFALPLLIPLLFFIPPPHFEEHFFQILLLFGSLIIFSSIFYMKALKSSDLSITLPMLSFSPLFLLITSPLLIGQFPSLLGLIGILLIVIGAYSLNITDRHKSYFAPISALIKEPGPRYMLAVAFIWSITANFEKIGVSSSSPIFWVIAAEILLTLCLFPLMVIKSPNFKSKITANWKILLPIGLIGTAGYISQMIAISLALVPYVISIKRTSILIGIIFGYFFFKEKRIQERLAGAAIMFAGVLMITLLA